jgi:hypothetical protein
MPENNENSEYQTPVQNNDQAINGNRPGERITDTPEQIVRFQIEEILKGVRTGMPGIVQKSFERQGAVWLEIQPALSGKKRAELGGGEVRLPIVRAPLGVINVGGFTLNLPTPVNGDEVWITCADRSIQTFVKQGGVGVPETISILTLNNAFALPFSVSNIKRKRVGEADDFTITGPAGTFIMKADGSIEINGNTDYAVAFTDLAAAIALFVTSITTANTTQDGLIDAELIKIAAVLNSLVPNSYTPTPIVTPPVAADISASQVSTVKLP